MISIRSYLNSFYNSTHCRLILLAAIASAAPSVSWAVAPQITIIADQQVAKGGTLQVTPALQSGSNASVNWSIAYGPDDVTVDQGTGTINWNLSSSMPIESFYVGLRASNQDGEDIEYFIVHAGVPKVVQVGPSHEVKNLTDALSPGRSPGNQFREPGTTFVVEDGTYTSDTFLIGLTPSGNIQLPPTGNSGAYSTVMAANPSGVTLSENAKVSIKGGNWNPSYMAIKGFFIDQTRLETVGSPCNLPAASSSCVKPNHIKFIANGVFHGNNSHFRTEASTDILFESNYVFGGRRAKLLFYKSQRVIARRNVARYDWVTDANNGPGPQMTYDFYTSTDGLAQNNIAVDSDHQEFWEGNEDAGEFACPTTVGDSSVGFSRNIQLNSEKAWGNMDTQSAGACVADLSHNISWDVRPKDVGHIIARGAVDINHMTLGDIDMSLTDLDYGAMISGYGGDTRGFRNSIIHNSNAGILFSYFSLGTTDTILGRSYPQTGVKNVNISQAPGVFIHPYKSDDLTYIDFDTITDRNPLYSLSNPDGGLKYIVRAEPNSNVSNLGSDGQALGARVMTMRGKNGTLYGESGYNQETGRAVWPYPMQEIIQEKMAAMRYTGPTYSSNVQGSERRSTGSNGTLSGDRGFAKSSEDLTHYIWGYLGNAVPPMNVSAQTDGNNTIVRWDKAPSKYLSGITEFKVYDYNSSTGAMSNPRSVSPSSVQATIQGSNGSTSYVVTAVHQTKGEGGYSYPSNGTRGAINASDIQDEPEEVVEPIEETPVLVVDAPTETEAPEEIKDDTEDTAEEVVEETKDEVTTDTVEPADILTIDTPAAPVTLSAPQLRVIEITHSSD